MVKCADTRNFVNTINTTTKLGTIAVCDTAILVVLVWLTLTQVKVKVIRMKNDYEAG